MTRPQWLAKFELQWRALKIPAWPKAVPPLPALAGGLALLLLLELVLPGPDAAPDGLTPALPAAAAQRHDDDATAWAATAQARPLFSPSRRAAATEAGGQADFTLPRLSAIIVTGATRRAIFAAPGQKPVMVSEGGEIGPYKITAIAPYSVRLLGPDGSLTLRPQASPAPPAAAANGNS